MEDEAPGEPEREDEEDAGIVGEALEEALEKEGEVRGGGDGKKEEEEKEEGQSEVSKAGANDKDDPPGPPSVRERKTIHNLAQSAN